MIAGNLNALKLATLPDALWTILSAPGMSLAELNALPEGRYQPEGAEWFYNIGTVNTAPRATRHATYRISQQLSRYSTDSGRRGDYRLRSE